MKEKVMATMERYRMLSRGERVVIGVSGGKDSVALLHILHALRNELQLTLTAVHIHHGIRGAEADRDERFVQSLCDGLGVELKCFHYNIPELAREQGIGEEACGRELRYKAFESIGADKIATAHTLSDSIETTLFHLARGSGSRGLSGIPPMRGNIIRPLIDCTSEEVLAYLKEHALSYVEDSTNRSADYTRNKIRLELVPLLQELNPGFQTHMAQTQSILREQNDYLKAQAEQAAERCNMDAAALAALPPALQHETIRYLCQKRLGVMPDYIHTLALEQMLSGKCASVQINSGAVLRVRAGRLEFPEPTAAVQYAFRLQPGSYDIGIGTLNVQVLNCKQIENLKAHAFSFAVDYDTIKSNPVCRNRQAGDRFYDAKRKVSKSMKKYLNEIAFAPEKRGAFPVFCVGETVIGTLGSAPAKAYAPDEHTKKVLYITLEEQTHG